MMIAMIMMMTVMMMTDSDYNDNNCVDNDNNDDGNSNDDSNDNDHKVSNVSYGNGNHIDDSIVKKNIAVWCLQSKHLPHLTIYRHYRQAQDSPAQTRPLQSGNYSLYSTRGLNKKWKSTLQSNYCMGDMQIPHSGQS